MQNLELNKIAASVILAGLIGMVVATVADQLYSPEEPETRGYTIAGAEVEGEEGVAPVEEAELDILAYLNQADPARGEGLTKKCLACHSFEPGGPNKVGPNLYGTVGADKAHVSGYAYSDAMATAEGSWTFENLSQFLKAPKAYLPGTKMVFAGIKDPQQRADLIAWLNQNSASPVAVPAYEMPEATPLTEGAPPTPAIDTHDLEDDGMRSGTPQVDAVETPPTDGDIGSSAPGTAPSGVAAPIPQRHADPEPLDDADGDNEGIIEHRGENAPEDSENNPPQTEAR